MSSLCWKMYLFRFHNKWFSWNKREICKQCWHLYSASSITGGNYYEVVSLIENLVIAWCELIIKCRQIALPCPKLVSSFSILSRMLLNSAIWKPWTFDSLGNLENKISFESTDCASESPLRVKPCTLNLQYNNNNNNLLHMHLHFAVLLQYFLFKVQTNSFQIVRLKSFKWWSRHRVTVAHLTGDVWSTIAAVQYAQVYYYYYYTSISIAPSHVQDITKVHIVDSSY